MKYIGFQWLKSASLTIRHKHNKKTSRSLHISGTTGIFNIIIGLVKLFSGILTLSIFICMNAGYTLGMVTARYCALAGEIKRDKQKEYRFYYLAAFIMLLASVLYVFYSIWSIWHPQIVHYSQNIAIAIAAVTFVEIGWNICGIIRYYHNRSIAVQLIKIINLATSIISLELTQAALLGMKGNHNPVYNGFLGVLVGIIAIFLARFMFWRINKLRQRSLNKKEEAND